ncbi:unnamed protein product [Calypogeia fissa]
MAPSWPVQMAFTLERNFRLKFRDGGHTFQEIVLPIYIIALLVVVKLMEPVINIPATPMDAKSNLFCSPVDPGFDGACASMPERPPQETLLAYVPQNNDAVNHLVLNVVQQFASQYGTPALSPRGFDTEEDMQNYYFSHPETVFAAIVFEGRDVFQSQILPEELSYSLRMNGSYIPSTTKIIGNKDDCLLDDLGVCDANGYLQSGFLALQSVISQVTRAAALPGTDCPKKQTMTTFVQQQALPAYHRSFASVEFQLFTALYMVLALSPVLQTTLSHIVQEKETLLKECMIMMGLRESVYWLAWLITYAGMSAVTSLILVFTAKWTGLFDFTGMGTLFLIIYPYTVSLITMAFAFSTVFAKAQKATSFSGLWIFLSSLVIIPIDLLQWSTPVCAILSLNSPVGLALAVDVIVRAEGSGQGVTLNNFWSTAKGTNPLSIGALVLIFVGDMLVYGIIAWYLDNTWPHPERGSKRPWGFCFSLHYWFPSSTEPSYMLAPQENPSFISQSQLDEASFVVDTPSDVAVEVDQTAGVQDDPNVEAVDTAIASKVALVCRNLRKAYYKKKKWWQFWDIEGGRGQGSKWQWKPESEIIKELNLNLYEGQLFAFVGHSKSGKSALLSILAGLSQGTSGEAYIYGLPISDGGSDLRSLVGFCPQGNIGLDLLTVREQLEYFARIKGDSLHMGLDSFERSKQPSKPLAERVEDLLQALQLAHQADTMVMELNASAKRKLSLAIALIGDPQVVLMDHPTVSMDADSKKAFWDMIKKHQAGRVFVFTTDSMEEADVIADRKAVLSHGVLKCCGSSRFLRSRFGLSYLLHITREESFNANAVLSLIQGHIPEATLVPTSRGQLYSTYKIPLGYPAETSALITELTRSAAQLGIGEGALEATTLEEVFMQFHDEDEEEAGVLPSQDPSSLDNWGDETEDLEAEALLETNDSHVMDDSARQLRKPRLRIQTFAMMRSRFALYRRNIVAVLLTFGLPVAITLGVLVIQSIIGKYDTEGLPLVNSKFGHSVPIYYTVGNGSASLEAHSLLEQLGPNHILLNQSSFLSTFNIDGITSGGHDAIGLSFDQLDLQSCTVEYNVLYQPSHIHELPEVVAMLDNSLLNTLRTNYSGNGTAQTPSSLLVANHPLPFAQLRSASDFLVIMLMTIGLLIVPPVLGAQVVADKELGLLSLFRVSGMRGLAYWIATAVSDLILYYIASFLVLAIGLAFGHIPFYKEANLAIFLLFLTTIPALALTSYVSSFFFVTAQGAASLLYMFFVLASLVPYFWILAVPGVIPYGWHSFLNVVDPPYALISGLHFIVTSIVEVKDINSPEQSNPARLYSFEWSAHILVSIGGAAVAILPLALCIWMLDQHETDPEPKMLDMPVAENETDAAGNAQSFHDDADSMNDLNREKERVQTNAARWESMGLMGGDGPEGDLVLCCGMGKNYGGTKGTCFGLGADPGLWALRNLWLAVGRGEVVVLVGGQKSGKSSLLHTLAGTTPLSFGDALINGESVRYSYQNHRRVIGLCPQYESMYYSLTVREHLELFVVLKGVPEPHSLAVEATLQALNLPAVADEVVGKCSVGIRRRLSIGIAMVGGSSVLLLDEPSSGTDIATRRRVWKYLVAQSGQRATLICTQSFEEAEAIGVRVGVLVSGQLKCLASPQELKRRYGSSYSLSVSASPENIPAITDFISSLFPSPEQEGELAVSSNGQADGADIELVEGVREPNEQHKLRVPVQNLSGLATLLRELEEKRESLGITEYVVSQPTLRQVFHRLTLGDTGETSSP